MTVAIASASDSAVISDSSKAKRNHRFVPHTRVPRSVTDVLVELDVSVCGMKDTAPPALKYRSTLIRGRDVRDSLEVMNRADWVRERSHAACWLMCHVFDRPGVAQLPMSSPDPQGDFFGYNTMRGAPERHPEGTTKDLVRVVAWSATALVARVTKDYVYTKTHLLEQLDDNLRPDWATFVRRLIEYCRTETNYAIPTAVRGRQRLRKLCERTRDFEDFCLSSYREYLIEELSGDDQSIDDAIRVLERVSFRDDAISEAMVRRQIELHRESSDRNS